MTIPNLTATACILISTALALALHLLRPDLNPVSCYESEYAVGPYSPLMTVIFVLRGAAAIALAVGLYIGAKPDGRQFTGLLGLLLLGVFGVGMWALAVYPTDAQRGPTTLAGEIHNWTALAAFAGIALAAPLITWSLAPTNAPMLLLSLLVTASCLFFYLAPWIRINGISGLTERVFIGLVLAWMLVVALRK